MPDYIKLKSLKQFAVSLDIYQKRFKISTSYTHSRVIIDLSFWRTLGMSDHGRLSPINFLLIYKKSTSFFNSFLTYWTFRNLTIWAVESSSLTRIQDLELCPTWKLEWEVKNQSSQTVFKKTNDKIFKKNKQNSLFWGPFWSKYEQIWNFSNNKVVSSKMLKIITFIAINQKKQSTAPTKMLNWPIEAVRDEQTTMIS